MNKQRRTTLAKALPMLVEAARLMAEAKAQIEMVRDEEQDALDNLSDGQHDSDLGGDMDQAIADMTDALDALATVDIGTVATMIAATADRDDPTIDPSTIDEKELATRRLARLSPWARTMIDRAEADTAAARRELASAFGEPDEADHTRATIEDYDSPMRGKTIPGRQIAFPAAKMRVCATRNGKAIEVSSIDIGRIIVLPIASNSVQIKIERPFPEG